MWVPLEHKKQRLAKTLAVELQRIFLLILLLSACFVFVVVIFFLLVMFALFSLYKISYTYQSFGSLTQIHASTMLSLRNFILSRAYFCWIATFFCHICARNTDNFRRPPLRKLPISCGCFDTKLSKLWRKALLIMKRLYSKGHRTE